MLFSSCQAISLSDTTKKDEVYHFKTELNPPRVASPKLFTKEFNPIEVPLQQHQVKATPTLNVVTPAVTGESPIVLKGTPNASKGISITPEFLQQLLASANKVVS